MKGFTLIEILVVSVFMLFIVGMVAGGCLACAGQFGNHKAPAENNLAKYMQDLGIEVAGSTCVNKDTDGDGYVSCTVRTTTGEVLSFECPGRQMLKIVKNEGCRTPKMQVRNNIQ